VIPGYPEVIPGYPEVIPGYQEVMNLERSSQVQKVDKLAKTVAQVKAQEPATGPPV